MRRRFDLTPLGHPAWWVALALLLINDNLFKGRGVVPGWLAGKISDFAFLVVAPVLFAAMIPRRAPGRRTLAVVSVVALYVAADLSRAVSDAVVAAAARVGLHWRLWPDPSDLLALAVLPITVWLLRRPAPPASAAGAAAARRAQVQRERAGIVLGALACVATSAERTPAHRPFLFNRSGNPADVRITWVLSKVDCVLAPEALAAKLGPSDLDDPRTVTLATGDVAALDGPPVGGASPVGVCSTRPVTSVLDSQYYYSSSPSNGCVAAILEMPGATPVLMVTPRAWPGTSSSDGWISCCGDSTNPNSHCKPKLDTRQNAGDEALTIDDSGGAPRFALTRTGPHQEGPVLDTPIQIAPIDPAAIAKRPAVLNGCRETRDMYHALLETAASCTSDGDCQVVPALSLPGEAQTCTAYVNDNMSIAMLQSVETQWSLTCQTTGDSCLAPLPAFCNAGRCAALCAGVNLPACPPSCSIYSIGSDGSCSMYDGDTCLNNTGLGCACNNGRLSCAPLPTVDPSCPLGCRPSGMVPPPTFDAGAPQDGGHDGGNDGGHDGASDGGNDGGQDGTATDATATDAAGTDATD